MNIDWKRVCKPQPDGYDSHAIAYLLNQKYGWTKRKPTSEFTLCDGEVAVVRDPLADDALAAPEDPMRDGYDRWTPEVAANLDPYLRTWEDGHQMLKLFLDEFWPKWSRIMGEGANGCSSGHFEMKSATKTHRKEEGMFVNAVYVTINSMQGCAEGIYHEVGHARLESLGIDIDDHDYRLILNTSDELYDSPIRRDKKRPMSAVIQAIYSWIIFGENDIQCAKLPGNLLNASHYLIGNIPKIEDGLVEIRKHVRYTPEGKAFLDSYFEWGDSVVQRAKVICKQAYGVEEYENNYARAAAYKHQQATSMQDIFDRLAKEGMLRPDGTHKSNEELEAERFAEKALTKDTSSPA